MKEKAGTGKWTWPGVPHKGWFCFDIDDLEDDTMICEMCEKQTIRWVHHMRHEGYPDVLLCGCVCAGNMEEDYEGAKKRETEYKNLMGRKRTFVNRNWRWSRKGNEFLSIDGYIITIFGDDSNWKASVKRAYTGEVKFSKVYNSNSEAKLAAFDAIFKKNIFSR